MLVSIVMKVVNGLQAALADSVTWPPFWCVDGFYCIVMNDTHELWDGMPNADWIDAFIADVETADDGKEEAAPLPRTESGTPTMPPLTEASAFRAFPSHLPNFPGHACNAICTSLD